MPFSRRCPLLLLLLLTSGFVAAQQTSGPDDRQPSDPNSITSETRADARPVPIEDLFFTKQVSNASWSPDAKEIVFVTDMTGRPNLWKVSAEGGWPIQLVQSDDRQFSATYSPDGKWIAYMQDSGGNELWDVYAVPSSGGEIVNLTNTPAIREENPRWSPDGKILALNTKPKDGQVYNISLLDWSTRKITPLTQENTKNHSWQSVAWSADGRTLYANRVEVSFTDSDVYAIDVATGKTTNLTPHQGSVLNVASSLSPDGKTLLITTNQKAGYQNVALLDVASKQQTFVTDTKWEANSGDFSPDGKYFTYTINADGRNDAFIADTTTRQARKMPIEPGMNVFPAYPNSFAPSGDKLLVSHESSATPADFWVFNLGTEKATQITHSAVASLSSAAIPVAQIVHYKSFDGKVISALLWMPFNAKRDGTHPAIVLPHGGPTGQSTDYFSPYSAALSSRGYICIAPNVRGSTGYGVEFQKANYQDLGGGDLQDEIFATKFLLATGYVDQKKIGITGGSYGGFMTLMALAKTPDVWAAGAEWFGIIDWMTMLQHSDALLQEYVKSLLGDPVKDRKVYEAASPITYIQQLKAPLLVLQGENDPRVPKEEADQVVALLRKHGRTVEAHYYPQEGHGFDKRENQIDAIRRTIDWFDKYLNAKQ
jgi:dipeptidyl aminopeptidase/acylaminoacyl peptidase